MLCYTICIYIYTYIIIYYYHCYILGRSSLSTMPMWSCWTLRCTTARNESWECGFCKTHLLRPISRPQFSLLRSFRGWVCGVHPSIVVPSVFRPLSVSRFAVSLLHSFGIALVLVLYDYVVRCRLVSLSSCNFIVSRFPFRRFEPQHRFEEYIFRFEDRIVGPLHIYIYIYMYTHTHTHTRVCLYILCVCYIHIHLSYTHMYVCIYYEDTLCMCIYIYIYTCMCIYIYICI